MATEPAPATQMASRYDHATVEQRWYDWWESRGYFRPDPDSDAPPFVLTIPPPNITGDLHLGSVLTYGIGDTVGRYKRMRGFNTLLLPGSDHAGIATQNVVERQLASEGIDRHLLGREKFVERVWQWKDQYGANIRNQFRAVGCSYDWTRERFTLDARYVDAVLEFFIRLYQEGKIYHGWRVINWCPHCESAISDIEVEEVTREDPLYYLRYPLKDGTGSIVVATVRPETILGDSAIAVHPEDQRYRELIGQVALLPLLDRELTVIADSFVDMDFGTGAVKITPAHDFSDFEVGERHDLEMPIAIDASGIITEIGGPYQGLGVMEARAAVLRDLESGGYLVKIEPHTHNVPTCERCHTLLEPLLSEQWFMEMTELARPAIDAVVDGRISFVPERWARIYLDWMERIRPWTLSRQLWWGHRIPVYYCADGHATAAKGWPEACSACGGPVVSQDPDVLDTWFSSALWPFAALGWPEETEDLQRFYPTSFMNTSSQILYLWISRMIMTGIKFRGQIPFPVVLINPTVQNAQGQRMSKSLGTGVDLDDLVATFGVDSLRFALLTSGSTHQQAIRFSRDRVEIARNFGNKLWNVARFIAGVQLEEPEQDLDLLAADRWILSRLARLIETVSDGLDRFEFSGAGHSIHDFVWGELADWYVEIAKARLYDATDARGAFTARAVLWSVLDRVTRLLHPYMPFLTEEVWQSYRESGSEAARLLSGWDRALPASVMIAPWPSGIAIDGVAEAEIGLVMEIVRQVRAVRSEYRVEPRRSIAAVIQTGGQTAMVERNLETIARLARLKPVSVVASLPADLGPVVSVLVQEVAVNLPLADLTDVRAERDRLLKELAEAERLHGVAAAKLGNDSFRSRAPAEVVS
ncbi:MAG: valine--tRNA ligase, partial [Chloroflexota bacterium]